MLLFSDIINLPCFSLSLATVKASFLFVSHTLEYTVEREEVVVNLQFCLYDIFNSIFYTKTII